MNKSVFQIREFLSSINEENLGKEQICIEINEVFQHDEAVLTKDEITEMIELTPEALHEELRNRADCFFYGATANECIKLVVTGSYNSVEIPLKQMIADEIACLEPYDITPASLEESYVRLEETLSGSERWQFPIASAGTFDADKLKITLYKYKVFGEFIQVIGEVYYDDEEIEMEISDSGLNPDGVGLQAYSQNESGKIFWSEDVHGDLFHNRAVEIIEEWQSM